MKQALRWQVKDEATRKKLTPNYRMGCKRILRTDDYWKTFNRKNVKLYSAGVSHFTDTSLVLDEGTEINPDVVIFATGFDASENMAPVDIIGRNDLNLRELWKEGGEAYKGTVANGFPNLFFIVGPNVGLGHNSLLHIIESQAYYIDNMLKHLEKGNLA